MTTVKKLRIRRMTAVQAKLLGIGVARRGKSYEKSMIAFEFLRLFCS